PWWCRSVISTLATTRSGVASMKWSPISLTHPVGAELIISRNSAPTSSGSVRKNERAAGQLTRRPSHAARGAFRLRLRESELECRLRSRGQSPQTLPAGKRGGWLHDYCDPTTPHLLCLSRQWTSG